MSDDIAAKIKPETHVPTQELCEQLNVEFPGMFDDSLFVWEHRTPAYGDKERWVVEPRKRCVAPSPEWVDMVIPAPSTHELMAKLNDQMHVKCSLECTHGKWTSTFTREGCDDDETNPYNLTRATYIGENSAADSVAELWLSIDNIHKPVVADAVSLIDVIETAYEYMLELRNELYVDSRSSAEINRLNVDIDNINKIIKELKK